MNDIDLDLRMIIIIMRSKLLVPLDTPILDLLNNNTYGLYRIYTSLFPVCASFRDFPVLPNLNLNYVLRTEYIVVVN